MSNTWSLLIKGGTLITPNGRELADIAIAQGKIVAIGDLTTVGADEIIDAKSLHVLPGVIDSQVHFRDPGHPHKETFYSGTKAAVLGGVTTVFDMPNTNPLTITADELQGKLARAEGRAWCNYAFYVGGCASNIDQLAQLESMPGCSGVKVFMGSSTGDLLAADDATLLRILQNGKRRVAIHAEDEARLIERRYIAEQAAHPIAHPDWRDVETALKATTRILRLARLAGRPIHVLHITSAEELTLLAQNKDIASVEALPQHLTLHAPDCYEKLGTLAQMNPPIRDSTHQTALWQALQTGVIDVIGSDHAPHTLAEKVKPYPQSPSGMPGVQTLLPLMLNHVANGKLTLERLVDLTSAGPARLFGIAGKGRIAVGYDADLTLVDLSKQQVIDKTWLASLCGWSPWEGMKITGWPVWTIIDGRVVMHDGALRGEPIGKPVRFISTLKNTIMDTNE
jgi:dihydroorotase